MLNVKIEMKNCIIVFECFLQCIFKLCSLSAYTLILYLYTIIYFDAFPYRKYPDTK